MPTISVSGANLGFAIEFRLAEPSVRRDIAKELRASIGGTEDREYASHVACPKCARRSAWFWISPGRAAHARCKHKNSCGWRGSLLTLISHEVSHADPQ
jgi:hypothetical protein